MNSETAKAIELESCTPEEITTKSVTTESRFKELSTRKSEGTIEDKEDNFRPIMAAEADSVEQQLLVRVGGPKKGPVRKSEEKTIGVLDHSLRQQFWQRFLPFLSAGKA